MTFSIVARDAATGELGVAVQTGWPGVGAIVPWVEPGVGAVATQSFTNVDHGPNGLTLMRGGLAAPDALRELLTHDTDRDGRQIGLVDAAGRSAAHTGSGCLVEAGHACAPNVSVQANLLAHPRVWRLMLDAFDRATGDLADRLVAALRAGEHGGGDVRGSQSASLLVAPASATATPWARRYDLSIDDSPRPLEDLVRLLRIARAYEALDAAMSEAEEGDIGAALVHTENAIQLAPDQAQIAYWHAMVLISCGKSAEARSLLEDALRRQPGLAEFGRRFAATGRRAMLANGLVQTADAYRSRG